MRKGQDQVWYIRLQWITSLKEQAGMAKKRVPSKAGGGRRADDKSKETRQ